MVKNLKDMSTHATLDTLVTAFTAATPEERTAFIAWIKGGDRKPLLDLGVTNEAIGPAILDIDKFGDGATYG